MIKQKRLCGESAVDELRLMKAAFDSISEGVAIADKDGRLLIANASFPGMLCINKAPSPGTAIKQTFKLAKAAAGSAKPLQDWFARSLKSRSASSIEFKTKDGRHVECRCQTIKSTGSADLRLWNVLDISDKIKVEEELGSLNSELEQRIEERTTDLEAESARSRRLESIVREVDERERERLGRDIHDMVGQT